MATLVAPPVVQNSAVMDEHSLLLWQTCAYADDLTDALRDGRPFTGSYQALIDFLHERLLPYLRDEEGRLPAARLRDDHLAPLIGSEHARLRADVSSIEDSRTLELLAMATERLVDRLERHVSREESWLRTSDTVRIEQHGSGGATRGSAWI
jgi:hypothetical protein